MEKRKKNPARENNVKVSRVIDVPSITMLDEAWYVCVPDERWGWKYGYLESAVRSLECHAKEEEETYVELKRGSFRSSERVMSLKTKVLGQWIRREGTSHTADHSFMCSKTRKKSHCLLSLPSLHRCIHASFRSQIRNLTSIKST